MIPTTVGSVVAGRDMGFVAGRDAIFRFSAEKKKANL